MVSILIFVLKDMLYPFCFKLKLTIMTNSLLKCSLCVCNISLLQRYWCVMPAFTLRSVWIMLSIMHANVRSLSSYYSMMSDFNQLRYSLMYQAHFFSDSQYGVVLTHIHEENPSFFSKELISCFYRRLHMTVLGKKGREFQITLNCYNH